MTARAVGCISRLCPHLSLYWVWKCNLLCDCLMSISVSLHVRLCLNGVPSTPCRHSVVNITLLKWMLTDIWPCRLWAHTAHTGHLAPASRIHAKKAHDWAGGSSTRKYVHCRPKESSRMLGDGQVSTDVCRGGCPESGIEAGLTLGNCLKTALQGFGLFLSVTYSEQCSRM